MVDIKQLTYLTKSESVENIDWPSGVLVPIDKPFAWTSFDVVNKLRYRLKGITGKKKFKVGHAGTLDPRATGLLLLACGAATKSIESLTNSEKRYRGVIKLGASTPSYDGELPPDKTYPIKHITPELIEQARQHFIGVIDQYPPIFSAIKKDGKRLYQYARQGQEVDIPSRKVEIKEFALELTSADEITFDCHCTKGTYIRSLAHDLGQKLDSGAFLKQLERTSIGDYSLDDAWELDELINLLQQEIDNVDSSI